MKKRNVFAIAIASLALALGVGAGLKANKVEEAKAYGSTDTTWYAAGTYNGWNLADADSHLTYKKMAGNNWEFESDEYIAFEKDDEFKIVYSWNNGANANYFGPVLQTNNVDFTGGSGNNIKASRDITVRLFFQVYGSDASWTGLYWSETAESKLAAANAFAATFLSETSAYCTGSISSAKQTELKTEFDKLGGAKDAFFNAGVKRGKGVSYDNAAQEALSRYVNMQEEKGYTDFLSLGTDNPVSSSIINEPLVIENNQANTALIIVIVSTISLVALGGFFFIKRKKEN